MDSNAQIVARGFAAIARDDLDTVLADLHDDVEWRPLMSQAPGEGAFVGHAGVKRWWGQVKETFSAVNVDVDEIVENGDRVYVAGSIGTESLHQPVGWVAHLRVGKVAHLEMFEDRSDARRAAGLDQ